MNSATPDFNWRFLKKHQLQEPMSVFAHTFRPQDKLERTTSKLPLAVY